MRVVAPWARWWFRVRVAGVELLPPGACLVAASHSALGFADLAAVIWLQGVGATGRPFRAAAHRVLTGRPLARVTRAAGGVRGDRETVAAHLRRGVSVLVCPGGCADSMRPLWRSRRAEWRGRSGYVEVAREAGVPIVPLAVHGSASTYCCLGSIPLPAWLRRALAGAVRAVPVTLGMVTGPAALGAAAFGVLPWWAAIAAVALAVIPLPCRVTVEVLPAVRVGETPVDRVAASVRGAVEAALRRGPPRCAVAPPRLIEPNLRGWRRGTVRV